MWRHLRKREIHSALDGSMHAPQGGEFLEEDAATQRPWLRRREGGVKRWMRNVGGSDGHDVPHPRLCGVHDGVDHSHTLGSCGGACMCGKGGCAGQGEVSRTVPFKEGGGANAGKGNHDEN